MFVKKKRIWLKKYFSICEIRKGGIIYVEKDDVNCVGYEEIDVYKRLIYQEDGYQWEDYGDEVEEVYF